MKPLSPKPADFKTYPPMSSSRGWTGKTTRSLNGEVWPFVLGVVSRVSYLPMSGRRLDVLDSYHEYLSMAIVPEGHKQLPWSCAPRRHWSGGCTYVSTTFHAQGVTGKRSYREGTEQVRGTETSKGKGRGL